MRKLFLLSIILFSVNFLFAQWVQTSGPTGGNLNCIVIDGYNIYVGSNGGGIFKSDDGGGVYWNSANNGITSMVIADIDVNETSVLAGTGDGKLYISKDKGENWELLYSFENKAITEVLYSNSDIYIGTNTGLYLSKNNGESWITQIDGNEIYCLEKSEYFIYAGTKSGLYRKDIYGSYFEKIAWNDAVYSIDTYLSALYVGTATGVSYSPDHGENGYDITFDLPNKTVTSILHYNSRIYVGTSSGIYYSLGSPAGWHSFSSGLSNKNITGLAYDDFDLNLYAITKGGFYASMYGTGDWHKKSRLEIFDSNIQTISSNGNVIYAGTHSGLFKSDDMGENWTEINDGIENTIVLSVAYHNNSIFVGTNGYGVFKSNDNGESWSTFNKGLTSKYITDLTVKDSKIYAGTPYSGVFYSNVNNDDWTESNIGLVNKLIKFLGQDNTGLYAATWGDGGIYKSFNGGISWLPKNEGIPSDCKVTAFAIKESKIVVGTSSKGIYLSTDQGENWTNIWDDIKTDIIELVGDNIFIVTEENKIYFSGDNGINWSQFDGEINDNSITNFSLVGNNLFAGTQSSGIWKHSVSDYTGIDAITNNFQFKIYPNPNDGKFNVMLQNSNNLGNLKVFDIYGKLIYANQIKNRTDIVNIDLSNQAKGVYILEIDDQHKKEKRKVIIN